MIVTLLGTGTPAPNPDRCQAAVLVEIGDEAILFDAGRGVVTQLARARADLSGVGPVFITHHHIDHINDLGDVIVSTALGGRTGALSVYGPRGTREIVTALTEGVLARDIRSRIIARDDDRRAGFASTWEPEVIARVEALDVGPGVVRETDRWRVVAGLVQHGGPGHEEDADFGWQCLGYRIESGGKVVTISGDTVPCDGIVDLARDADLLVQCCHFPAAALDDPSVREMTRHTLPSAGQAASIAAAAGARHLVLTHLSAQVRGDDALASLREEARANYPGRVTVGEDLRVFEM